MFTALLVLMVMFISATQDNINVSGSLFIIAIIADFIFFHFYGEMILNAVFG